MSEINRHFELSQPTMSRHLLILKKAHLVTDRRVGRQVLYRLSGETLMRGTVAFFSNFRGVIAGPIRSREMPEDAPPTAKE